ncbi:hypothetical protein ACI3IX_003656 [Shigella boydii]|uniref:Respiratory nitrate reductase 2 alpha chain n=1 Tax=Escherichia coli TaxID=562 RepID=A0A376P5A1_ECOLX|nr:MULTISPECIES: hypothetical protein [Enterobacteriaceae]WNT60534.1 hypothetical protein PWR53_04355 [Escherichia coli]STH73748.1 respiratory nitrate reductase 2 alpha chain [Escherichia coli]STI26361.1 respiratory nitrate reductase 2 alpha chain [Escherichia coli]
MSKLLDRFRYFKQKGETFADGHGQVMHRNELGSDALSDATRLYIRHRSLIFG